MNNSRTPRAVHQSGYADVLLRPTMVGILRCGKMLPPQLNLVIEIEFADATTALWSENAEGAPGGSHAPLAPIGAARQEDNLLESQMQLGSLYPHNPMKGASEHFHFLSVLAGTYDDTVRNIDIDRAGYLRHSFIAGRSECPRCPSVVSAPARATWLSSPLRRLTAR